MHKSKQNHRETDTEEAIDDTTHITEQNEVHFRIEELNFMLHKDLAKHHTSTCQIEYHWQGRLYAIVSQNHPQQTPCL